MRVLVRASASFGLLRARCQRPSRRRTA